jgi:prepilin-type N-terminal cleavage/methylation domain-containing protein
MQIAAQNKKHRSGFTLIEVAIATVVTAIAIMALYSGMTYSFAMVQLSRESERATQIILDQMERMRILTRAQIEDDQFCPPSFTERFYPDGADGEQGVEYTINIFRESVPDEIIPAGVSYRDNMLMVRVEVRWMGGNVERVREMKTLVSSTGMQRYVYNN